MPNAPASTCEQALAPLVGARLRQVGRAGFTWFSFGEPREHVGLRGDKRIVGSHSLHLQCPWRLHDAQRVLLAAHDRYAARANPADTGDDYDCDALGASWFDRCAERLNERAQHEALRVRAVEADVLGGFRLLFDGGLILDAMPVTSYVREHWRIFATEPGSPHFVAFVDDVRDGPTRTH